VPARFGIVVRIEALGGSPSPPTSLVL